MTRAVCSKNNNVGVSFADARYAPRKINSLIKLL